MHTTLGGFEEYETAKRKKNRMNTKTDEIKIKREKNLVHSGTFKCSLLLLFSNVSKLDRNK